MNGQAKEVKTVDIKIGSPALAKIISRAERNGQTVVEANGLLSTLAEEAMTEIGRFMVANGHASLSYEPVDNADGIPIYGLVARVMDQTIVIRLSTGRIEPAVVDGRPAEVKDFQKGDLVKTPAGPAEVKHWADVWPNVDLISDPTRVPVFILDGWRPRGFHGWASYLPGDLKKYPDHDTFHPGVDVRILIADLSDPVPIPVLERRHTPDGPRFIGTWNYGPDAPSGEPERYTIRIVRGPGGTAWTNAGFGWTRA